MKVWIKIKLLFAIYFRTAHLISLKSIDAKKCWVGSLSLPVTNQWSFPPMHVLLQVAKLNAIN